MSKGSYRRPCLLTPEAEQLQFDLAFGKIKREDYDVKRKELEQQKKWWKK